MALVGWLQCLETVVIRSIVIGSVLTSLFLAVLLVCSDRGRGLCIVPIAVAAPPPTRPVWPRTHEPCLEGPTEEQCLTRR